MDGHTHPWMAGTVAPDTSLVNRLTTTRGDGMEVATAALDNVLVRRVVSEPGDGQVLVVDGGGSLHTSPGRPG
jgi:regulator of RNase E activity RraA